MDIKFFILFYIFINTFCQSDLKQNILILEDKYFYILTKKFRKNLKTTQIHTNFIPPRWMCEMLINRKWNAKDKDNFAREKPEPDPGKDKPSSSGHGANQLPNQPVPQYISVQQITSTYHHKSYLKIRNFPFMENSHKRKWWITFLHTATPIALKSIQKNSLCRFNSNFKSFLYFFIPPTRKKYTINTAKYLKSLKSRFTSITLIILNLENSFNSLTTWPFLQSKNTPPLNTTTNGKSTKCTHGFNSRREIGTLNGTIQPPSESFSIRYLPSYTLTPQMKYKTRTIYKP